MSSFWPAQSDRIRIASTPGERFRIRLLDDHYSNVNGEQHATARDVVKFVKTTPGYQGAVIVVYQDAAGQRYAGIVPFESVAARVPLKKQPIIKSSGRGR